ncbi:MAG: response regulator transcription factor [Spirochaetia bacterium]
MDSPEIAAGKLTAFLIPRKYGKIRGMKILLAEDEKKLNTMIHDYLNALGFTVTGVHDGLTAVKEVQAKEYDIAVLDIMLPGIDGIEVLRKIREEHDLPVIMLTARDQESDKLMGLELGADDYMTKPFSMKELAARVRALLRRSRGELSHSGSKPNGTVSRFDLTLYPEKRILTKNSKNIDLTSHQFDIISLLMRYPGKVFSRADILSAVQDMGFEGYERTVDVHIKNIRKKLGKNEKNFSYVETVWGFGYRFREEQ